MWRRSRKARRSVWSAGGGIADGSYGGGVSGFGFGQVVDHGKEGNAGGIKRRPEFAPLDGASPGQKCYPERVIGDGLDVGFRDAAIEPSGAFDVFQFGEESRECEQSARVPTIV